MQVLSSLFFRNRTAYIVGRIVNGFQVYPFVVPLKHDASGRLYVDALLMDPEQIALLFSANRAYFLVDMEVPSAYVTFLRGMVPCAPKPSSTRWSACRSRARRSSSATSCITSSIRPTTSPSRRESRGWS